MADPPIIVAGTPAAGALDDGEPQSKSWALYAYLCGDNPTLESHTAVQIEAIRGRGGSSGLHVAVQWDLPGGAARAIAGDNGGWSCEEPLGRRDTGDPGELAAFLTWALERCPATNVIVVLSGTGLLDPRASVGRPDTDRSRIFTVLDDTTERDALALASLRSTLRAVLATASRDHIDIVAFDVRELQFLEVAYELEGLAEVVIAPQTRIPDHGWDFTVVLDACRTAIDADAGFSPVAMSRLLVETIGTAYLRAAEGALSVSALDLRRLNDVADAFDTMCLAMLHSVGDEMVWEARDQVFKKLRSGGTDPDGAASCHAAALNGPLSESDWLYDLFEMLSSFEAELRHAADQGLVKQMLKLLRNQDASQLLRSLRAIQNACFVAGSRLRSPELQVSIAEPQACRRALRRVVRAAEALLTAGAPAQREKVDRSVDELFTTVGVPAGQCSWLDGWPDTTLDLLPFELAREYRTAQRSQVRTRQLAQLTARVVRLLRPAGPLPAEGDPTTLVFAHFSNQTGDGERARHFGVSLFRPRELDYLVASDYLQLNFTARVHWTALMAVINLIGRHPRALWRVLSAVLATADQGTRSELLSRISGPDSVLGSFRQQFSMLAPLSALVLSLEQNVAMPRRSNPKRRTPALAARNHGVSSYRVRLERAGRNPLIEEAVSVVNQRTIDQVLSRLVSLLNRAGPATMADVQAIEALGRSLGEDILQRLGHTLADAARLPAVGGVHLQLQIPRPLMPYPWELMQYRGGWLSEHFALGRQVFASSVPRPRSRPAGPLRALVIGNPVSTARSLSYGLIEAERVARMLERLRDETDGLVDFDRARDARIDQPLTGLQLRDMLRQRQYDIIHFAGHASFAADQPENSAWMLTDGPLSAQSLSNTLDWCDSAPWLVFANACEAGMDAQHPEYQGDVFGLASAFLMQGVGAYIAPLWPIDDAVAADVATIFYEKLLKDRETVGESLRQARVAAKRKYYDFVLGSRDDAAPTAAEPKVTGGVALVSWAGMVLYGSSTTTVGQRVGAPTTG